MPRQPDNHGSFLISTTASPAISSASNMFEPSTENVVPEKVPGRTSLLGSLVTTSSILRRFSTSSRPDTSIGNQNPSIPITHPAQTVPVKSSSDVILAHSTSSILDKSITAPPHTLARRVSGFFSGLSLSRRSSAASLNIQQPARDSPDNIMGEDPEHGVDEDGDTTGGNVAWKGLLEGEGEESANEDYASDAPSDHECDDLQEGDEGQEDNENSIAITGGVAEASFPSLSQNETWRPGPNQFGATGAPKLRLPPSLTQPAPRTLSTAIRSHISRPLAESSRPNIPSTTSAKYSKPSRKAALPSKSSGIRPTRPPVPTTATSSFAARALARLPPPGRGASSSSKPVQVLAAERAQNIAAKRAAYEAIAKTQSEEKSKAMARYSAPPRAAAGMSRTIPVAGETPGKASRQRAEERARFEAGLRARIEEKERRDEAIRRAREELEREEMRLKRLETIVWAKPAPTTRKD